MMAALCSLNRTASQLHATVSGRTVAAPRASSLLARAYKVQINQEGTVHTLEIPDGKTILEVALDKGLDLPHDCKLGVCMTCPAKLTKGVVDQSGSMLSDDVAEKGYVLMCMAMPQSDCEIVTVTEDELLEEQLCA